MTAQPAANDEFGRRAGDVDRTDRAPLPLPAEHWERLASGLRLSPGQARVVELILRGLQDKQIAAALRIKVPTVRTYVGRVYHRLGVGGRLELVLLIFALSHGRDTRRPGR